VLKLNYRNTDEIMSFAYRFARQYLSDKDKDEDHVPLVVPDSVGRHGPQPAVRTFDSYEQEARYIAFVFSRLHEEQGISWSDMCVTYRSNWMGETLNEVFSAEHIPTQWLRSSNTKRQFKSTKENVKLMTMHSSKGLEFPVVAVSGVGYMPGDGADKVNEAKLLYVAMTRSTEKLLLTSHRETEFLVQLRDYTVAGEVRETLPAVE